MPSCGGPGGQYRINGKSDSLNPSFNSWVEEGLISQVELIDEVLKGVVTVGWDRPATLWRFPLETVAQSESGWEKTYQSSVIMPIWCFELNPGEEWRVAIELGIEW